MEELFARIQSQNITKKHLIQCCYQNNIEIPKIAEFSIEKVSKLYNNFRQKYGSHPKMSTSEEQSSEIVWYENELNLFHWTAVMLSQIQSLLLKDFGQNEIKFLSQMFRQKEHFIISYELRNMMIKGKQIRNSWKPQQESLLEDVVEKAKQKNRWNQIARQLFKVSGGIFFRQGKHCRQRWYSFIQKNKNQYTWSINQDIQLLQLISVHGKKWHLIQNKFKNIYRKGFFKNRLDEILIETKIRNGEQGSFRANLSLALKLLKNKKCDKKNEQFEKNLLSQKQRPKALAEQLEYQRVSLNGNSAQLRGETENRNNQTFEKKRISQIENQNQRAQPQLTDNEFLVSLTSQNQIAQQNFLNPIFSCFPGNPVPSNIPTMQIHPSVSNRYQTYPNYWFPQTPYNWGSLFFYY